MNRIVNRIVIATALALSLGAASQSFAEGKIECSIMKDGKSTQQIVATAADCTKLGGKVVAPTTAPKPASPKPLAK
jgi:hypothetical protein